MPARSLNLGILAHVDAGKTTLTERLLHLAGVIDEPGSVDSGTTRTDTLALERRRGITIKAAVVAFPVGDTTVNVVDTPGHPDFIAEVERVLAVLDGAVLVLSAIEGVQPQTRILMRALQRLHVPTLLFLNKIDRMGADPSAVLAAVRTRLTSDVLAMGSVTEVGSRAAGFRAYNGQDAAFRDREAAALAEHDDTLLASYVEGRPGSTNQLHARPGGTDPGGVLHPVYAALRSPGRRWVLMRGIETCYRPRGNPRPRRRAGFQDRARGRGEKVAYVRMVDGAVRPRQRLDLPAGRSEGGGIERFRDGTVDARRLGGAGQSAGCPGSPRSTSATPSVGRVASRGTTSPRRPWRRR